MFRIGMQILYNTYNRRCNLLVLLPPMLNALYKFVPSQLSDLYE